MLGTDGRNVLVPPRIQAAAAVQRSAAIPRGPAVARRCRVLLVPFTRKEEEVLSCGGTKGPARLGNILIRWYAFSTRSLCVRSLSLL